MKKIILLALVGLLAVTVTRNHNRPVRKTQFGADNSPDEHEGCWGVGSR
jgi:hypothetical protein